MKSERALSGSLQTRVSGLFIWVSRVTPPRMLAFGSWIGKIHH